MKRNYIKNIPLIFLAIAIAFSPSFIVGKIGEKRLIEIRIEDILLIFFGLIWIIGLLISKRKKLCKPPLFTPILVWLSVSFFSLLINLILGNIELARGFFYFLKEIEFFFLYFYLFYHIKDISSAKSIINFWVILGGLNVLLIIFQLFQKFHFGKYGPGMLMEGGPFPSGGFFLITFTFLLNILLHYYFSCFDISKLKKIILTLVILSLAIGVIASVSRISIGGLVLSVILSVFLYQLRNKKVKSFFISFLVILILLGMFYIFIEKTSYFLRFSQNRVPRNLNTRINIWKNQITAFPNNLFHVLFGLGKSVYLFTEESHNQYVRNFIETGIIGSLVFFVLIIAILKTSWQNFIKSKNNLLAGTSAGVLVSTLSMLFVSTMNDAFIVVKVNEVYWFFIAITAAIFILNNKEQKTNLIKNE